MIILRYPTWEDELTDISDSMTGNNEAALMNISVADTRTWLKTRGAFGMGKRPCGDNTPYYWLPTDTQYIQPTYWWEIITPWFVTSKGVNHTATNTRINISGITIQLYDTSINAWRKLDTGTGVPTWGDNKDYSNGTTVHGATATKRIESDDSWSFQFQEGYAAIHGGSSRFTLSDAIADSSNIGGVFVTMKTRLVLDDVDGVDDRHLAEILMDVGADYWPRSGSVIANVTPMTYIPNVAISRFELVGVNPRTHFMATITPPNTSADFSDYIVANGVGSTGLPVATFNANVPPYIP